MTGERIKTLAIILGVLIAFGGITLAAVYGRDIDVGYYHTTTVINWGKFLGIMLGTYIGGFIECWLLYAFGDAVSNAQTAVYKLVEMEDRIVAMQNDIKALKNGQTESDTTKAMPIPVDPAVRTEEIWTCKKCGRKNAATEQYCLDCGFIKGAEPDPEKKQGVLTKYLS